jgi:hypothetical protein
MALVIDATPAGLASNSYATLAEADQYHVERLHSEVWDDSDDATKNAALVMATRLMDSMLLWAEYPTTVEQALQWPRSGMLSANQQYEIDPFEIPIELKRATAEFARQLITSDTSANSDIETQGIASLSAGGVSLSFREDVKAKVVPDAVTFILPSWWFTMRGSKTGIRNLMRA